MQDDKKDVLNVPTKKLEPLVMLSTFLAISMLISMMIKKFL